MRSRIWCRFLLVAALSGGLMLGEVASAHTVLFPTSLSLAAGERSVPPGTVVTFTGNLDSPEAACRASSQISLMRTDDGFQVSTTTKKDGSYKVTRLVKETGTFQAVFDGKILSAVHPHNHACAAAASNTVTVIVT